MINDLLDMVASGAIPSIENAIETYKRGDETLYGTILAISILCDTYRKILQMEN